MLRVGAVLVIAVHVLVGLSFLIGPYPPLQQDRDLAFAPPTHIHFVDAAARWHARPFVYPCRQPREPGECVEDPSRPALLRFLVRETDAEGPAAANAIRLIRVDAPGRLFLFGTDGVGRDVFSRVLAGGRWALLAGWLGALLAVSIGGALGAISAWSSRGIDAAIVHVGGAFLALPWLYLLLALRALGPLTTPPGRALGLVVLVLGFAGWVPTARLVRSIVLTERERDWVKASRAFGASTSHVLRAHILPPVVHSVLTHTAFLIPQYMLVEIALSFFGLGVGEPHPSWGNMLAALLQYHVLRSYWWMAAPALLLVPLCVGFHLIAEGLAARLRFRGLSDVGVVRSSYG